MLDTFNSDTFEPGDVFTVDFADGEKIELVLAEIRLGKHHNPNASRAPFALVLKSGQGVRLSQGLYRMENDKVGQFEMFMVPVLSGDGNNGGRYEACFS